MWLDLEDIVLSETSQNEKINTAQSHFTCEILYICIYKHSTKVVAMGWGPEERGRGWSKATNPG